MEQTLVDELNDIDLDEESSGGDMDPFEDQLKSKDGLLVTDENNKIIVVNQVIEDLWLIPNNFLKSKSFIKLMNFSAPFVKDSKKFLQLGLKILKDKNSIFRDDIYLKDGRIINFHTFPMYGADKLLHGRIWYFRDITEQKQIEDMRNMQSLLMENLNEGVALASIPENKIVYTNPKFEKIFGYEKDELLGKHISELNASYRWKSPLEISNEIENELREKNEWNGRMLNVKKDGSLFWTHLKVSPLNHSEFGDVWVSLQSDISQHVKTEDELKISEERFRLLFEKSVVPMMIITVSGEIIAVNGAAERLFGRTKKELVEAGRSAVINFKDKRWEELNEIRRRTGAYQGKFSVIHKDGHVIEVEGSSSTLFDSEGKEQTHIVLREIK